MTLIEPAEVPRLADNVEQAAPGELAELLRYRSGQSFAGVDPESTPGFSGNKADGRAAHELDNAVLKDLQERLFANTKVGGLHRALILVLQGRDSSGKGGIVRHVAGAVSPHGVVTAAFGVPTDEEAAHHFLWRVYRKLPRFGTIAVFDRSHYEDILVPRVRGLTPPKVWQDRYDVINEFEEGLVESGVRIIKVMLTISPEEQAERLRDRIVRIDKQWKHSRGDLEDRRDWDEYTEAFEDVLERTSTEAAPWYIVPADRKWYSRWAVVRLLIDELQALDLQWPRGSFDPEAELALLEKSDPRRR